MRFRLLAVVTFFATLALAACAVAGVRAPGPAPGTAAPAPMSTAGYPASVPARVTGIVSTDVTSFDDQCGCRPDAAVHYVPWGENPAETVSIARKMLAGGAVPMLEIEPYTILLSSVAAGKGDQWLAAYARAVASLRAPVLLSFAPEANGDWYPWGWDRAYASPATEVSAWRHVVTVFRAAGVTGRWVWIVNRLFNGSGPLAHLWPGRAWASEIGIDGYFRGPAETFTSVFGPTVTESRRLAPGLPVLVSETGASPQAGKARAVRALAAGVSRYRLSGFVWFNVDQGSSAPGKGNWSLTSDPAALAAYRKAAASP